MSRNTLPRIFFLSVLLAAALLIMDYANATTSALDSALNNSLQESRDLAQSMNQNLAEEAKSANHKVKARSKVEINLDEPDREHAANYKDSQATGNLREDRY